MLWHIMKVYSLHGINEFIVCCGYKGHIIKEYFSNYFLHMSDVTLDLSNNTVEVHKKDVEPWKITLVNTGEHTLTGGRIKRVQDYMDDTFCLTYGDGISDLNITELIKFHKAQNTLATVTAIQPSGRFGALGINGDRVDNFFEKPDGDGRWISGGFFVCQPEIFSYINNGDETIWEREPLENLAKDKQLSAYKHHGFWAAMDTLADKNNLEKLWASGNAPWKNWE